MRTVCVWLRDAAEMEVVEFLSLSYRRIGPEQWNYEREDGETVLFIRPYIEKDPDEVRLLQEALGGAPTVGFAIDVSGRHDGRSEVTEVVVSLLDRWGGVANDDFSDHFWNRHEISSDQFVGGYKFFDMSRFRSRL